MIDTRTDLAVESFPAEDLPEGVSRQEYEEYGFQITDIEIRSSSAANVLCKPIGRYISIETERFFRREENAFAEAAGVLAKAVRQLLSLTAGESVLIAGLGNRAITPDAVGPETVSKILVTRHLIQQMPEDFGQFRPVCAVETGVLGTTGLESTEYIRALFDAAKPDALIAVDALAARGPEKLCRTVQLTDSGIVPGSGVGNHREELSSRVFGVPVLAVGIPTVVDAGNGLITTRRDIDQTVQDVGKLVAYGLNLALQEGLGVTDIDMFVG